MKNYSITQMHLTILQYQYLYAYKYMYMYI